MVMLAQASGLGDGKIDNWIIDSSVHVTFGIAVLVTMTLLTVYTGRLAVMGRTFDTTAGWLLAAAQLTLAIQVLLGIKLLDQGQGISQLYIHYVGGLVPLGVFMVGGWWVRTDSPQRTRIFAVLLAIGWFSAVMAFTIGRSYVNR